jgi:hypothetical protein
MKKSLIKYLHNTVKKTKQSNEPRARRELASIEINVQASGMTKLKECVAENTQITHTKT